MIDNLDTLLNQPLAPVPDNGFSARMAALVELQQLRRERLRTELAMGAVVLAVLTIPFTPLGAVLSALAFTKAGMGVIALAAAAIVFVANGAPFKRFTGSLA